jgi:uncharacterized protein YdaU (DUF1376 family)
MSSTPWMPLYVGDYLAGTGHLTVRQHGQYLLMLMHHWRNGPLPDDDHQLAQIARSDPRSFHRHDRVILRAMFVSTPDGLVQPRLMKERAHIAEVSEKRAEAGRRGGRPRKGNGEAHEESNSFPFAKPSEKHSHSHSDLREEEPPVGPHAVGTGTPQAGTPPGRRAEQTNPRAEGTNPRSAGTNPREVGACPRSVGTNAATAWPPDRRAFGYVS